MVHKKACMWNGIYYNSVSAAAAATGKSAQRLSYLILKGYSSDADFAARNRRRAKTLRPDDPINDPRKAYVKIRKRLGIE